MGICGVLNAAKLLRCNIHVSTDFLWGESVFAMRKDKSWVLLLDLILQSSHLCRVIGGMHCIIISKFPIGAEKTGISKHWGPCISTGRFLERLFSCDHCSPLIRIPCLQFGANGFSRHGREGLVKSVDALAHVVKRVVFRHVFDVVCNQFWISSFQQANSRRRKFGWRDLVSE